VIGRTALLLIGTALKDERIDEIFKNASTAPENEINRTLSQKKSTVRGCSQRRSPVQ
jgi:hypothetical protein